eukprot:COSAG05_NODE_1707_length_4242_cov_9.508086_3_plen_195_part_00
MMIYSLPVQPVVTNTNPDLNYACTCTYPDSTANGAHIAPQIVKIISVHTVPRCEDRYARECHGPGQHFQHPERYVSVQHRRRGGFVTLSSIELQQLQTAVHWQYVYTPCTGTAACITASFEWINHPAESACWGQTDGVRQIKAHRSPPSFLQEMSQAAPSVAVSDCSATKIVGSCSFRAFFTCPQAYIFSTHQN